MTSKPCDKYYPLFVTNKNNMNETTEEKLDKITKERDQWRDCANKLVESSGWHDLWPQAVAHYRKLKEELK
jgi:hypothetical protein